MSDIERRKLRPAQIARAWGIAERKVIGWIRAGELPAINVGNGKTGRPRFLIDKADLEAFEKRRAVVPTEQRRKLRSKRSVPQYV